MDIDLMKALFQCYNPATKSFHRKDGIVLCTLDRESFIEAFGLTGAMGQPLDLKDLQRRFEAHRFYWKFIIAAYPWRIQEGGRFPKEDKR